MDRSTWMWIAIVVVIIVVGGWWWVHYVPATALQTSWGTSTTLQDVTTSGQVSITSKKSLTIGEVLAGLSDVSQFERMLVTTGTSNMLFGSGPYTVFVSTDAGYRLLLDGTISRMNAAQQKRFAQYAIVRGRALDIDAVNSGEIRTLSGDTLNFHVGSTGLVQVNSSFALEEYKANNGIIYVINQPLLPPVKAI